jgi:SAM-dependent methyltransferase
MRLRVAEINVIEGIHGELAKLPHHSYSDYVEGAAAGSLVAGARHEDLRRLSYADASFDLVLTSETLEHVPDLRAALSEIRRVLAGGGRHVFTIPLLPGVTHTFARAVEDADGHVRHLVTPIHHPGGDVGYPVFTEFGADLPDLLRSARFDVEIRFGPVTEDDLAQVYCCRIP